MYRSINSTGTLKQVLQRAPRGWFVVVHESALLGAPQTGMSVSLGPRARESLAEPTPPPPPPPIDDAEEQLYIFNEDNKLVKKIVGGDGTEGGVSSAIGHFTTKLCVEQEHDSLLNLLPEALRRRITDVPGIKLFALIELHLDFGKPIVAHFKSAEKDELPMRIGPDLSLDEIKACIDGGMGTFGPDNRAGVDGTLHRISCMTDHQDRVYGLTMRVGRTVSGNVNMLRDLLFDSSGNILLVGVPGCGKTSVVREVARILAESKRVVIVDTSNEIAGDGLRVHPSVGNARRMMVNDPKRQERELIECVQNHTPEVIVVDELGTKADVEAVSTVEKRGVRLIASAHGDLKSLLTNKDVNALVGGIATSIVGDMAAERQGGKKHLTEQARPAIFKHVIELTPDFNVWHVHLDVNKSVKAILAGESYYEVQERRRMEGMDELRVRTLRKNVSATSGV